MSTTNSGGLWTVFQFSFLPKLQAAVWHQEAACEGTEMVLSFPAVWPSMGYSPSLSLYFLLCNLSRIILPSQCYYCEE